MLLLLIPIAWLAVVTPLLAACVMASRADGPPATPAALEPGSPVKEGLVVWDPAAAAALAAARGRVPLAGRPRARHGRRHRPAHNVR